VLTANKGGTLTLWNIETGSMIRSLLGHSDAVNDVKILADGRHAISSGSDRTLRLWDLGTGGWLHLRAGRCINTYQGHTAAVTLVVPHPDGRTVLSAANDHTVRCWDLKTGKCLRVFETKEVLVTALAIHPDRRRFLTTHMHPRVGCAPEVGAQLWDGETGKGLEAFRGIDNMMSAFFLPDGTAALLGLTLNKMLLVDLGSGRVRNVFACGDRDTLCLALSHSMDMHPKAEFAITAWAHYLRLWDLKSGQNIASWYDDSFIDTCCFAPVPSGFHIVYGNGAGMVVMLALKNLERTVERAEPTNEGRLFHNAWMNPGQTLLLPKYLPGVAPPR
jgi:WD40 repeat protein